MSGPMSWYRPDALAYGIEGAARPGYINSRGDSLRVYGGPLDGGCLAWPGSSTAAVIHRHADPVLPPFEAWSGQMRVGYTDTHYSLHEFIHAPEAGCEGPIGVEWIVMTHAAFLAATAGADGSSSS